ncbi:MAG TPA: response regulator [Proteobacteria bacterium]|nr:response regulator [Pseudomonadota bacterium]
MKILVVDDDTNFRHTLVLYLNSNGWEVDEAADGLEGWSKLKESPYDVVITDIEMPGMDGFTLRKKAKVKKMKIKFIYMSAYPPAVEKSRQDTAWLTKPFMLEKLHRLLQSVVPKPASPGIA